MDTIIDLIISFPTAIWTVPLGVSVFFWLLTILGALDIEMLDVDVDASPDLEADIDIGGDVQGHGLFHGLSDALAIGTVPTTIVISSIASFGWISSVIAEITFAALLRDLVGSVLYALLAMVVTFLFAVWITTKVVRPLKPIFITHVEHGQHYLIGQIATITSSRVSDNFGIASLNGKDITLNVICDSVNQLAQGDEVSIVAYDEKKNHYLVAPLNHKPVSVTHDAAASAAGATMPGNHSDSRTPAELAQHDTVTENQEPKPERE